MRLGEPAEYTRFIPLNRILTEEQEPLGLINVAKPLVCLSLSIFVGCEVPATYELYARIYRLFIAGLVMPLPPFFIWIRFIPAASHSYRSVFGK